MGELLAVKNLTTRFYTQDGVVQAVNGVSYSIDEGEQFRVGRINVHIAGEYPHTQESVILDRLSIRPGDIVDIRKLRNYCLDPTHDEGKHKARLFIAIFGLPTAGTLARRAATPPYNTGLMV